MPCSTPCAWKPKACRKAAIRSSWRLRRRQSVGQRQRTAQRLWQSGVQRRALHPGRRAHPPDWLDTGRGVFSVSDTASASPPQHIPRLTERVLPRRSRPLAGGTGGTGLGLAIVKHVLARHHARLDVHSELTRQHLLGGFNADHLGADGVSVTPCPRAASRRPVARLRIFAYCLRLYPVLS